MPASPRRKAFGQHFLRDTKVITKIVEKTCELYHQTHSQTLLEIGPGKGALTLPILESRSKFNRMILVEKDRAIANEWITLENQHALEVHSADFLDLEPTHYLSTSPITVVSNLPYSAGTAILLELLPHTDLIPAMILMFQKEVAERLYAKPKGKAWGSLSLHVQNLWEVEKLISVSPSAFIPPPDVDSEVVVLMPRAKPLIEGSTEHSKAWDQLLRAAFTHRRKMLRSAVPKVYFEALIRAGIDPTLRSDALTWEQWEAWMAALIKSSGM
jgi:16S rRNA (adenine1518-N6/adenine1519-N6)-dimethyltransferase